MTAPLNRALRALQADYTLPLTLLTLAVILFFRRPDMLIHPQFWAEDGAIFFRQNYEHGLGALFIPYAKYIHLIPRLVAYLASFFPVAAAPALYAYATLAMTLGVGAKLLSPRLALPYKPLLVVAVALVPTGGEVILNLTNIHWYTALLLIALVLQKPPTTRWQLASDFFLLLLAGLTGPFIIAFAPLFLLRWLKRWDNYSSYLACGALLLTGIQGYAILGAGGPSAISWDWAAWIAVLGRRYAGTLFLGNGVAPYIAYPFLFLITVGVPAAILFFVARSKQAEKLLFPTVIVLFAAALVAGATFYKFKAAPEALIHLYNGDRYFYLSRLMVMWGLIFCLSIEGLAKRLAAASLLLAVLAAATTQFQVAPMRDYAWGSYAPQVEQAFRSGEPLQIPINPPGWNVKLNVER